MYIYIYIYICIHIDVLIAPIRPWILGPWADPQRAPWAQRALAPDGRLGPGEKAPWAPGPAPLRGQGHCWQA